MGNRRRLVRKIAIGIASLLVVALVLGVTVIVMVIRRPLPTHAGTLKVAGLQGEVKVLRDQRGVPHLYASTDHDLLLAQGFVHAQDRFFEMDYRRHVTAGRLAELVGDVEAAKQADVVIRTMGWRKVAEEELSLLSPETRALLQAYTDGVNAYISGREASQLSVEYTILGLKVAVKKPEPWQPADSLAWLKAMAWDLKSNYHAELARAKAYAAVGDIQRVNEIFPPYPYHINAPIVPAADSPTKATDAAGAVTDTTPLTSRNQLLDDAGVDGAAAVDRALKALTALPNLMGSREGVGSNSFVVGGAHTKSGKPLLANDPHLSDAAPGLWYQMGLHCVQRTETCTLDVSGFSFSGMPGIVIGHNDKLAWGLTNMGADVADFFMERVNGTKYERDGQLVDLETRKETIHVNGGKSFEITVSSTVHGPILSEALPALRAVSSVPVPVGSPSGGVGGYAISLSWTALTPGRSLEAVFAMNRAANADDVKQAAALFEVPAQNIVFATVDGDFGYQAPGKIPLRNTQLGGPVPSDGTWPRPGWDSRYDWQGYVAPEDMPRVLNPAEGFIVAANQAVTAPGAGPAFGSDFSEGFRSQRIRAILNGMIGRGEKVTSESAARIMMDSANPLAQTLVPAILRLDIKDKFLARAVDELRKWRDAGYPNDVKSPGAAYFNAIWANLVSNTFGDELTGEAASTGGSRWMYVMTHLMASPRNSWWDDINTVRVTETRDEVLVRSLEDARAQLTNTLAKDPAQWRWGDLHKAHFEHPLFAPGTVPDFISSFMNPAPFPVSGGTGSVLANNWQVTDKVRNRFDYRMTSSPSMRMVVDLANLDDSMWVASTGTSGHAASKHYTDQLAAWGSGKLFPWAHSAQAVQDAAKKTLTLQPR